MLTYQCKCCGAPLDIKPNIKICKCTFCEVMQTIPLLDYDEKAVLWERADNLRRSGEYDRAAEVYDQLVELDDQEPDVFWSKMLCRYGVEYVEENGSNKRIPTINRIQYQPVIDDEDYRAALKLADGDQQRLYAVQAMQLEELRKEILSVSMTAEPYDIFICYKETDASGRRTDDSVLAGQLYRALTAEGWKVFFARISLEDKAGTEYEPYIFAALNSARLMLAVGTSPENFNAVWVRNEWNRYLYRISERNEGNLVVLYKNMLPQHLPEEFAHLQSFDMSAPDFMDELLRGARKLLSAPKQSTEQIEEQTNVVEAATAVSLLRRAELCLEDGEFDRADEFCELALNCEPENADVYFTKLLAEYRAKTEDELTRVTTDFSQSGNYKKAMRFGDERFCTKLSETHRRSLYNRYCIELDNAAYESQCEGVALRFSALGDYLDSSQKAEECKLKAQRLAEERASAAKERKYAEAKITIDGSYVDIDALYDAQKQLRELGEYKDSALLADKCAEKIKAFNDQKERELAEKAAIEEKQRKASENFIRILKKALLIGVPAVAVIICGGILINQMSLSSRYDNAVDMCERGEYDAAMTEFVELSGYKDSSEQIKHTRYLKAMSLFENRKYDEATEIFSTLGAYKDSKDMLLKTKYYIADEAAASGNYDEAVSAFVSLGDYSDSAERVLALKYDHAVSLRESGDFSAAADEFEALGGYSDCQEQTIACRYAYAQKLFDNKEFELAAKAFERLGNYSDSAEKVILVKYSAAGHYAENGEFEQACELYKELGDYSDCKMKLSEMKYLLAEQHLLEKEYDKAMALFEEIPTYSDAKERIKEAKYGKALALAEKEDFEGAIAVLEELGDHSDADIRLKEMKYSYAVQLAEEKDFEKAIRYFTQLGDYLDSAEKVLETKYNKAIELRENAFYDDADKLFTELGNYSDARAQLRITAEMRFTRAQAGDKIKFGSYVQTALGNNAEIEWKVIDRQGTRVLVISEMLLDCRAYGGDTWENSSLRSWLNSDFINTAFSTEEREMIPEVTVEATDGGVSTYDRVFILSCDEIKRYSSGNEDRRRNFTDWAEKKYRNIIIPTLDEGVSLAYSNGYDWWLRDLGDEFCHKTALSYGSINTSGERYDKQTIGVRPAMWIEMGE